MRDYKRLREAAQILIDKIEPDIMLFPWRWLTELTALHDVLTDTPKDSGMERLVEWMQDQMDQENDERNWSAVDAYKTVLRHVRTEFGYGEE